MTDPIEDLLRDFVPGQLVIKSGGAQGLLKRSGEILGDPTDARMMCGGTKQRIFVHDENDGAGPSITIDHWDMSVTVDYPDPVPLVKAGKLKSEEVGALYVLHALMMVAHIHMKFRYDGGTAVMLREWLALLAMAKERTDDREIVTGVCMAYLARVGFELVEVGIGAVRMTNNPDPKKMDFEFTDDMVPDALERAQKKDFSEMTELTRRVLRGERIRTKVDGTQTIDDDYCPVCKTSDCSAICTVCNHSHKSRDHSECVALLNKMEEKHTSGNVQVGDLFRHSDRDADGDEASATDSGTQLGRMN